jgi:dipeptidyl aminopeptidase/acylaminoacyl peptidase
MTRAPGLHTVHDHRVEQTPIETRAALAPDTVAAVDATASWRPTLAPDGRSVAFVSDRSGTPQAWVTELVDGHARLLPTGFDPVHRVRWSPDGRWIACLVAPDGAARTEVWVIRPDGGDLRQVAGFGDHTATFGEWSHHSSQLAVAETGGPHNDSRAFLLQPDSGRRQPLRQADLLAALDVSADDRWALLRHGPRSARWLEVVTVDRDTRRPVLRSGHGSTDAGHFVADTSTVLVRTDVDRDLAALLAVDLTDPSAEPRVAAERDDAELEAFTVSGDGSTAALLWNVNGGRSDLTFLDPRTFAARPGPTLPGAVISDVELSPDGRVLVCTAQGPDQPRTIWRVDVASGKVHPVTYGPAAIVPDVDMTPTLERFAARDGLALTGWLYRSGDGPGPTALWFHGGPESQHRPTFSPLFRDLVARGINVFAPNVRGSSGFGRRFVNADNRERRHAAIDDVAAAVDHMVARGVADPARVGCMGRSYGGYLTLAALVRFPDLFAAGVDVCGMADLETFYERTEPWIAAAAVTKYGHPEHDRELLRELSPLHRIDRLRAPLLVVHGAHDTNVPLHEAEQVVAALDARRATWQFLRFADEGHEILARENRAYYIRAVGDWFVTHLDAASAGAPVGA